jgi:hypothetical protein
MSWRGPQTGGAPWSYGETALVVEPYPQLPISVVPVRDAGADLRSGPVARGFFLGDYQGLADASGGTKPGFHPLLERGLFTLASPGSPGVFPNPNLTDEFIDSAF